MKYSFSAVLFLLVATIGGCGEPLGNSDGSDVSDASSAALPPDGSNPDGGVVGYDGAGLDAIVNYRFVRSTGPLLFSDDFERPNGAVGNGWSSGDGGSFSLSNGAAVMVAAGNVALPGVLREIALADFEACGIANLGSDDEVSLFLRGTSDRAKTIVYRASVSPFRLGVARATVSGTSTSSMQGGYTFAAPIATPATYELCVRISGSDVVVVEAGVFDAPGSSSPLFSTRMTDMDFARVTTPGSFGLGAQKPGVSRWESVSLRSN